jgi:hypothetical protein
VLVIGHPGPGQLRRVVVGAGGDGLAEDAEGQFGPGQMAMVYVAAGEGGLLVSNAGVGMEDAGGQLGPGQTMTVAMEADTGGLGFPVSDAEGAGLLDAGGQFGPPGQLISVAVEVPEDGRPGGGEAGDVIGQMVMLV